MSTHVVYRLIDRAGMVLYVGRSCNLAKRIRNHSDPIKRNKERLSP